MQNTCFYFCFLLFCLLKNNALIAAKYTINFLEPKCAHPPTKSHWQAQFIDNNVYCIVVCGQLCFLFSLPFRLGLLDFYVKSSSFTPDWLTHWLIFWLTDWLTDWLTLSSHQLDCQNPMWSLPMYIATGWTARIPCDHSPVYSHQLDCQNPMWSHPMCIATSWTARIPCDPSPCI